MSSKIYVLDGALVQCNQGMAPATLMVTQNTKVKIQGKFKATDMDTQIPQTFIQCKLKPTSGGFLPCIPALQKWMKTSKKTTLGKSKKFLYEDSECMCSTGGKISIIQPMQINTAGAVMEEFKNIAMTIPGAMLGNDKAPKVVESYWMNETNQKKINTAEYGEKAVMFVRTENVDPGKPISINVKEKNGNKIDGQNTQIKYTGEVQEDGTAKLTPIETQSNWNK